MNDDLLDTVLNNIREKITSKEPLTTVEEVVLREYLTGCRAQISKLELKSQNIPLSEPEVMRLNHYRREITSLGG